MIILNTEFSNEEKDVLLKYAGNTYLSDEYKR